MKLRYPLLYCILALTLVLLTACAPAEEAVRETALETTFPPATEAAIAETSAPPTTEVAEELPPFCDVSYLFYDQEETGKVQITRYVVQEYEEHYCFSLEYSAEEELKIEGYLSSDNMSEPFLAEDLSADIGENILEFSISKEVVRQYTEMNIFFLPKTGENISLSVSFPVRIQITSGSPIGEPMRIGYLLNRPWKSNDYQIHDCYIQKLDNGFFRYTLDMTLPKRAFFSVHILSNTEADRSLLTYTINGRHQYVFDISMEDLLRSREITVLLCEEVSRYENLISIPSGLLNSLTDGTPVGAPSSLEVSKKGYGFSGCSIQRLDNGFYRYTLNFAAKNNTLCSVFDPPNGDAVFYKFVTTQDGDSHTFSFDVDADAAEQISELTFTLGSGFDVVIKNDIAFDPPNAAESETAS